MSQKNGEQLVAIGADKTRQDKTGNDKTGESSLETLVTGSVLGFPAHDGRAGALGEVHARPHALLEAPRLIIQLSFMTEGGSAVDQAVLADLSRRLGVAPPQTNARHHAMKWGKGTLRWERHTEFSSYQWDCPISPRTGKPLEESPFGNGFSPPGTAISGTRVEIRKWTSATEKLVSAFDPASLGYSVVEGGRAAVATDFRQDGDGLTRILILEKDLAPARIGALSQRLIDIETYRTLAMLGLPLAQSLSPRLRRMEDQLAALTARMRQRDRHDSQELLGELTELAAELEADAAASLYRFGASRAYHGIVEERLETLSEAPMAGYETWAAFLQRRVAPAMRTCRSVEERQANLSRKLTRAANLLRSWVDVEVERQNRDLLASMNRRAQLQLRLQQTVEGLSVAAISYYVVGLVGYVAKGAKPALPGISSEVITAAAVPVAVLCIWLLVRRIRRHHAREDASIGTEAD